LNKPRLSYFADQHDPPTEKHWLITTHATQLQENDGYLWQKPLLTEGVDGGPSLMPSFVVGALKRADAAFAGTRCLPKLMVVES